MGFSDVLQGGLGGATAGAGIGGPYGALVGGGIGMLGGALGGMFGGSPGGSEQNKQLLALANEAAGRQYDPAAYSSFRGDQTDYLGRLRALSSGQGPSLASEMLRQNTENATANQAAMAAGARGNAAMAARQGMNNAAGITAQGAQSAAMARAQEQLGALQQLGLGIYGARGQDESMNQFNAQSVLQQQRQNDATRLGALGQSLGAQQYMGTQPTAGNYLLGAGGSLGQIYALARQGKQDQAQQAGQQNYGQPGTPGSGYWGA